MKSTERVYLRLFRGPVVSFADEEGLRAAMDQEGDAAFREESGATDISEIAGATLDQCDETVAFEQEMVETWSAGII